MHKQHTKYIKHTKIHYNTPKEARNIKIKLESYITDKTAPYCRLYLTDWLIPRSYTIMTMTHKVWTTTTPMYLSELVQTHAPPRALHSSDAMLLVAPRIYTESARRAFSVAAPSTWNSLPADIQLCENILTFKCWLKTHLFKLSTPVLHQAASISSDLKALYKSVIIIIMEECRRMSTSWQHCHTGQQYCTC